MSKSAEVHAVPVSEKQVGLAPIVVGAPTVQLEKQFDPLGAAHVMIVATQLGADENVAAGQTRAHDPLEIFPTDVSHDPD